jgi:hypothetical protein
MACTMQAYFGASAATHSGNAQAAAAGAASATGREKQVY